MLLDETENVLIILMHMYIYIYISTYIILEN